jgi:glycerate 2-kinase
MNLRETAKDLFLETLRHLSIEEAMTVRVKISGTTLSVGRYEYNIATFRHVFLVSMGKAAVPMLDSMLSRVGPLLRNDQELRGIAVGSSLPSKADPRVQYLKGDHPLPGVTSQHAADAILRLLSQSDSETLVLFLISGGASAMVEMPLDPTIALEESTAFHKALVHSGLPIQQMNALRKHFSRVKGGRLAVAAHPATQSTLLISDVPNNLLHIVSSGPSLPDPSTVSECRKILRDHRASLQLSPDLLHFFEAAWLEETPKADHPAFRKAAWTSLLSSDDLCSIAGMFAASRGFHVVVDNTCDDWDYREAAPYLLEKLRSLREQYPRICLLSAGELSVPLTKLHGTGGRNQQFALECAKLLARDGLHGTVLSGGSDGVDGNSSAAGGVCDETTASRAEAAGWNMWNALERFDSFPLLEAIGDVIMTGPTGNNVRDLRILLSE